MIKIKNRDKPFLSAMKIFMFAAPFLLGGIHPFISALFSIVLSIFLVIYIKKEKEIYFDINITTAALVVLPAAYFISSFYAVDTGAAIFGAVKFFPVLPACIIFSGLTAEEKDELIDTVPESALCCGIISAPLSFIPALKEYLTVAGRFSGTFQYPNTFALFCLLGFSILLLRGKTDLKNIIKILMLAVFLLFTGSRTVFVLFALACIVIFIKLSRKDKIKFAVLFAGLAAFCTVFILASGNIQTVGRFLTISGNSSTLLGRLLYYKDALPVILRHPFGLGYYGYFFTQPSFQTGLYSVMFIHCEPLQFLLDIGWLPSLMLFASVIISFLSKNISFIQKFIMFFIIAHSCFDFDLQFIYMVFILMLTLDYEKFRFFTVTVKKGMFLYIMTAVILVFNVYMGITDALRVFNRNEIVEKIYGADTMSEISLMISSDSYSEIDKYADKILARNEYVSIAYSAKANKYLEDGNIEKYIEYKQEAIEKAPYSISEYKDYIGKMLYFVNYFSSQGDSAGADFCINKILYIYDFMEKTKQKTDSLSWKLSSAPDFTLPEEYMQAIDSMKNYKKQNNR